MIVAGKGTVKIPPLPPMTQPTMDQIVGEKYPGPLKKTAEYIADLADPAKRVEALDGLIVLRDALAGPALTELLYSDQDLPLDVRGRVVQAIYWSLDHKAAFDILLPVVARDEKVKWAAPNGVTTSAPVRSVPVRASGIGASSQRAEETPHGVTTNEETPHGVTTNKDSEGGKRGVSSTEGWRSIASLIAHLAGLADYQPAIPTLIEGYNRGVGMNNRPAFFRAFGRLKAKAAVPLIVKGLSLYSDESAPAAEALGLIGDGSVAPEIVKAVVSRIDKTRTQAILYAESARALGRLNARFTEAIALLERLLAHEDEEVRGAAAEALGVVGQQRHAAMLHAAAAKEPFEWVRKLMTAAAGKLGRE